MASEDVEFEVRLARTGTVVPLREGESIVDALRLRGVEVPTSCSQGVCGTCVTRVLEGEPDHWDMFLTPEEQAKNDQFCPCISRSNSPVLVLDL